MMPAETLRARLEGMVGAARVQDADRQTAAFAIAACKPLVVVQPETPEQAAAIVAFAGRERLALIPWGQGTRMYLGNVPQRYDVALSLADLTRIVDYDAANLTLIAEAGLPLRDVYRMTVPQRQFLPLGFPGSMASLGGVLVTNSSGVKRLRYGGLRDLLLGVRVALPDGSDVRFGGRVVKNVAGYDMNKLFVGSLGAFGVVLETTYRLASLPEDDRLLAVLFPTLQQATAAAAALQATQLLPAALTLLSTPAIAACAALQLSPATPEQVALLLNIDGTHAAVERQLRDCRTICEQQGSQEAFVLGGQELLEWWEFQEHWRAAPPPHVPPRLHLRLGTLSSDIVSTVQQVAAAQPFCQTDPGWLADYSSGQVSLHLPLEQADSAALPATLGAWLQHLRQYLSDRHGYCVVEYAPAVLRQQLDVWGTLPAQQLLRLYKQHFDPHAVLNPGRYVAGL